MLAIMAENVPPTGQKHKTVFSKDMAEEKPDEEWNKRRPCAAFELRHLRKIQRCKWMACRVCISMVGKIT